MNQPATLDHDTNLEEVFDIVDQLATRRRARELTQGEVGQVVCGNRKRLIALESHEIDKVHVSTLQRYAQMVGCRLVLVIEEIPEEPPQ